ncbi:hypothetical protein ELAC_2057 [Estrella lausannensis]|uniref:Uncharacterized protein n=1 Tax=Estrella lausannensis TaxID=483423 RepID=A0A0H5DSS7_9BACT|nr:hypothetical protein ELAC_2057 [Estrella lausannensis]
MPLGNGRSLRTKILKALLAKSPILQVVSVYTPVELKFSKQFPHYLAQDKFLHSITPLMREGAGKVQWSQVEREITQILDRFSNHDFQKGFLDNREMSASFTHHLLIAKEGSSPLGALYCMMSKTDNQKVVRVPLSAIHPEAEKPRNRQKSDDERLKTDSGLQENRTVDARLKQKSNQCLSALGIYSRCRHNGVLGQSGVYCRVGSDKSLS